MSKPIRRAAVIGAGVMGSGIAAHFANAGIEVLLMDIVPPNLTDAEKGNRAARNRFAAGGLEKAVKSRPAAFFSKERARLVTVGNVEDDLEKLKNVDLVIEAIIEQVEPKRALFAKLEKVVPDHAIVASNTSGLRITEMMEGRSASFRQRFIVMHFFNPVRYMKLLELVAGPETSKSTIDTIKSLGEDKLGKGVVFGKDTPNFVGNRIGCHAMLTTIHLMLEDGLQPEDVDGITGEPIGHPKSASFRTADLVGVDTFVHVADNCYASLTKDEDREVFKIPAFIKSMVEKKLLGDKTKGGFYRKGKDGSVETLDPKTLEYRPRGGDKEIRSKVKELAQVEDLKTRMRKIFADDGKVGQFAWKVLSRSLAYSARRIGEITDDIVAIDEAMRWGYNWELGPFESWDAIGFEAVHDRMKKDGLALPPSIEKMRASGAKSFYTADGKVFDLVKGEYRKQAADPRTATLTVLRKGSPVLKNEGAEAYDLGDGVLGLTFKSKSNSIDADVIKMIEDSVAKAESDFGALVIANQGEHFCVGANLMMVVMSAQSKDWDGIRSTVKTFQDACQRMKYASVPVVAAPYGMTLGGGLEVCLGAGDVQAAAETYAGLVEVGVGLVPGGGGTMNLLWRAFEGVQDGATVDSYALVTQVFKNIAMVRVATSAEEAKTFGYFRRTAGVSFDRARQLADAKARAIGLANSGWTPPAPRAYVLPGESGMATLAMMIGTLVDAGQASPHDAKIAGKLAEILCGGVSGGAHEVTENEMLEIEREAFLSLCGETKSQERMQYMLMNNKPLRN
ncbi:MAG TPA: 3-hydroxyacyl-CoA dehydrogenase/enoyl-CoA hydratase family protein [Polyangiaceae bacterium]|jgi:3-hydroxyacyl-CoA dehydrogenase|nr:3-hydroxyacyl-CoA dehydrogenase/enoyl-CoA hydratase family protein [Polyangiaceae bacterium]